MTPGAFVDASAARLSTQILQPSVTTWTRLEPQPRDATLERSLQAQVRDPLWFLARQWQVGEFAGEEDVAQELAVHRVGAAVENLSQQP